MQDTTDAIRRLEASLHALDARMRGASGDLDYESYLYEKRALTGALLTLRQKRAQEHIQPEFSEK